MKDAHIRAHARQIGPAIWLAWSMSILPATSVIAGEASESAEIESSAQVQIWLDDWRSDLPPGVSLIVKGGGLINNGFPALSADHRKIAVFYYAGHPLEDGYPTLDIYSTASLALQERIEFFPEHQQIIEASKKLPDLKDQELLTRIDRRLIDVNRSLTEAGFRSIPKLFELKDRESFAPIEKFGKRFDLSGSGGTALTVTSLATNRVEWQLPMPAVALVEGSKQYNDCTVMGGIEQAWYAPEISVLIVRMTMAGGQDGCELPERWLFKRLDSHL